MQKSLTICLLKEFTEGESGWIEDFRTLGHTLTGDVYGDTEAIILGSITYQDLAIKAKQMFPDIPLITYCWDFYNWAWDGKNKGYDWVKYRKVLEMSQLVLVPSCAQKLRLKELFDIDSTVVHASVLTYNHDTLDGGYVLDPVRNYPDENLGWVEKACGELKIPYVHTEHGLGQELFRKTVSECTFMTCAYREASTGGLTLIEGLWNGKASLVSDSPFMGAVDYLGDYGYYFKHDSYEDLKEKLKQLWELRPQANKRKVRPYIKRKFSAKVFAQQLEEALYEIL